MGDSHLIGDSGLRETKLAERHYVLVLSQALLSLPLLNLGFLWPLLRRVDGVLCGERGDSSLLCYAVAMGC